MRVVIAGGAGNLGTKLAAHLGSCSWCDEIVILDRTQPAVLPAKARTVVADFRNPADTGWRAEVAAADALCDFATTNKFPDCGWADAAANFEITATLLTALGPGRCRIVLASSTHVFSGYMTKRKAPGSLTPETRPNPDLRVWSHNTLIGPRFRLRPAYGSSKLMAERLVRATALASQGRVTAVSLRLGWVQDGANLATTLATPRYRGSEVERDWFRNVWLSNRDLLGLVEAALRADAGSWPEPAIAVNAVSANAGSAFSLEATARLLGYAPVDDVWRDIAS